MTALYISGATCVVTLGSGLLALWLQARRGWVLAFGAGALIAGALLEVLPEALTLLESTQSPWHHHVLFACCLGFLLFYGLERSPLHYATHAPETPHTHSHPAGTLGAIGIGLHSFLDGFAIGEGFHIGGEVGWVIALAVLLHKLADGVSVVGVMLSTRHASHTTMMPLGITAVAPLLGVGTQALFTVSTPVLALMLGWFAGVFLYLGASSLLPAAHAASQARHVPVLTLAGATFIYLAQLLVE
jgi:ZIP family zinc transporter